MDGFAPVLALAESDRLQHSCVASPWPPSHMHKNAPEKKLVPFAWKSRLVLETSALGFLKNQRYVVAGTVNNAQHRNCFALYGVKNQVVTVQASPYTKCCITRHQRERSGQVCQSHALLVEIFDKLYSQRRVVIGDEVGNLGEIGFGMLRQLDVQADFPAIALYLTRSRVKTSSAGLVRPASMSSKA